MLNPVMYEILLILFISTFIGSTFGFGLGMIAMSLLALVVDLQTAAPLVALEGLTVSLLIFLRNWQEINFNNVWRLILSSLVGIPLGLFFLKGVGDLIMKIVLAWMIILFALISLKGRLTMTFKANWPAYLAGLFSGIVGSAYNMGGPPVIIYGTLKKWPPATFRATLQGFFLPVSIFIVLSHAIAGLVTELVLTYYLYSLPILFLNVVIGGKINRSLPTEQFNRYIHIFLIIIGITLFVKSIS